ncbi:hypothetical protein DASB73_021890 [Starmerella bacillaris]|uniref:TLC domain-containing protein n=1 Tax=Starmerella bacillaris TaxID=1247836 RepID=A0AAV5RJ93_STABA|nr:hypothetical protein DASB73_021890 [Starmerella bacillaris]
MSGRTSETIHQRRCCQNPKGNNLQTYERPNKGLHKKNSIQRRQFLKLLYYQTLIGGLFFFIIACVHYIPAFAEYKEKSEWFLNVQYINADGLSHAGYRDFALVASSFAVILLVRSLVQLLLFAYASHRHNLPLKSLIRFTEQGWSFIYYGSTAFYGWKLLYQQPYGWDAASLWVDFPHYYIDPRVKQYYLFIFGHWISQIAIIHLEERRSDHYQMLTHHFVTCALVWGSYSYGYTRIGHLVMIMMDFVDSWLAIAKCSKYLNMPKVLTDSLFAAFIFTWILFRHFVYMYEMLYGMIYAPALLEGKCAYDAAGKAVLCYSQTAHRVCAVLTIALQIITLVWLWMIIKVVLRVVNGQGAADTRSDEE